ncbi:MAG: zinc-ribbon domain-containing protein [Gemmatimonadales bacterium]
MNVTCGSCQTVFRVDPAKVPASGVRARCSICGGIFRVSGAGSGATRTTPAAQVPGPVADSPVRAAHPAAPASLAAAPPRAAPAPQPPPPTAPAPAPVPQSPPAGAAAPPVRRAVNPFLSQDPKSKARRLARALVSDIVVYHPEKRRDGLRNGTLKLLFEEEIQKSWEEYSDQIGLELAQSTPYFHEALNEILADGQPIFP